MGLRTTPIVILPLLLGACGTADVGRMALAPAVPAAGTGLVAASVEPYRIRPGDVLDLRLPLSPELDEEVTVRPDGGLSTTLVPDAQAAGLTVPELEATLDADYRRVLRAPHLSVIVRSVAPMQVFVAGEVMHPGEVKTDLQAITLSEAIASAGGLKLAGDRNRVFILRHAPDGRPVFLRTRYGQIGSGADARADVRLAASDVVFVPRTSVALGYQYFNQYLQQFLPVSWGFSYVLNQANGGTTVTQPTAPDVR